MKNKNPSIYPFLVKRYHDDLISNLKKFCAIDSVYDPTTADKVNPFGKGVSNALQFIEELAKKDGFKVTNYDNMIVEILEGEGDKNITIMAHADVVPPGDGWTQDPFIVTEKKGALYGRGVSDDKGPLLASYYALKALRDNHLLGDYQVRLLVGGNEERGASCAEHYFKDLKKYPPTLGFSPDADYPLIYAEKGIMNFEVKKKVNWPHIYSINGGVASNCVIEKCVIEIDDNPSFLLFLKDKKIPYQSEVHDEHLFVTFSGKSAHGSAPQNGVNAGIIAIDALAFYYDYPELHHLSNILKDVYGRGINAYNKSKEMGENSMNVGLIKLDDKVFTATVNFRYVDGVDFKKTIKNIEEACKPFSMKILSHHPLLYYPLDSVLVTTLLKAYQEETGDYTNKPLAIGGGTYAKDAENIIAFGMEPPGVDYLFHSPKEFVVIKDLDDSMAIYAHAIIALGNKL